MEIEGHLAVGMKELDMIAQTATGIPKDIGCTVVDGPNDFVGGNHIKTMVKTIFV